MDYTVIRNIGAFSGGAIAPREDDAFARDLFHENALPMWVYDLDSLRFLAANEAALAFFRCTRAQLFAMDVVTIRPSEAIPAFLDFVTDSAVRYAWTGTNKYRRHDGTLVDLDVTSYPLLWEGRTARCVVGMDSAARRRDAGSSRHTSLYDSLTGLPGRPLFVDRLAHTIRRGRRGQQDVRSHFYVLLLDLDRFGNINDSLGFAAGDELLTAAARRLRTILGPAHTLARIGADEFAVLVEESDRPDDALVLTESLLAVLTGTYTLDGQEVTVTGSVGIVHADREETAEGYLRNATIALRRAKQRGKGRYEVFDTGMHERVVRFVRMENELRHALERNEFRVHYQPIVGLTSGTTVGFEALVRWQHPERGLVPPAEFIPVAEETGLLGGIARWIRHEACTQMQTWRETHPAFRDLTMSINISGSSFADPGFVAQISSVLGATGLPAGNLKMEITESVMMSNVDAIPTLHRVRDLGVHIGMDDFGTGYSSLSYLHRLPVDTLKVDRSFIWNMGAAGENVEIVRAIVRLGQTLGMDVVAEGIETGMQRELLAAMGCELGQGYLFARPAPPDAVERLLTGMGGLHLTNPLVLTPPAA